MAFSYTGGATARGTSTTASITHGLTINSGDLVVAYINRNDAISIDNDGGGAAWTQAINETPSSETAQHSLFWKVAGASEPSSYSWTLNGNDLYQVILKVFTSSTDAVVDAAATSARGASKSDNMVNEAIDGAVISDDAVSLVFCGKDNRGTGGTWATVDNSYTGVLGETDSQDTCGAHRIYTTGTTFSGSVTFTDPGPSASDNTYGVHISFVESATGSYTLTADSASYTYTATAVDLQRGLILTANSATYTYSATDVALNAGFVLTADSATYAYNATDASLLRGLVLSAESATYIYSATDVTLTYTPAGNFTLTADSATYTYTATDAGLLVGRNLQANSATYAYSATAADLYRGYTLAANTATYNYSVTDVELIENRRLVAQTASYIYTATDAALTFALAPADVPPANGVSINGSFGSGVVVNNSFGSGAFTRGKL